MLQHLVGHSLPYRVLDPARDPPPSRVPADLRRLPRRELPLVVAVRMKVGFPEAHLGRAGAGREPRRRPTARRRCAAAGSPTAAQPNFPIHLFDSFVPMWPTFGISLQQAPASAQDIAPWLPEYSEDGQADRHDGGTDDHHRPARRSLPSCSRCGAPPGSGTTWRWCAWPAFATASCASTSSPARAASTSR
ncbi:MAG: hypothetical protein U1F25_12260 [Rubrivivax sp.]